MANKHFQPKASLSTAIDNALASMPDNVDGDSAVLVCGTYGEKGVLFFPQSPTDEADQSWIGFTMVGKDIPSKHYNMSRDAAVSLVELLAGQFGIIVEYDQVCTIEVTAR